MRFPGFNPKLSAAENRVRAEDLIRQGGSERRPQPPRGLIVQCGSRGFLVSWSLPEIFKDVTGWRVYRDTESSLYKEISDRGNRQCFIESTGGGTPTKVAVFVSSINAYGRESRKVQVIASAATEAGVTAPPNPGSPPGYTSERSGGADRTVRDRTRAGIQL